MRQSENGRVVYSKNLSIYHMNGEGNSKYTTGDFGVFLSEDVF